VVLEYINNNGERIRQYCDFICDHHKTNKNDYYFVYQVWQYIMNVPLIHTFDEILIWSDGGPHHFKTRYCQWMWHHLSTCYFKQKRITHNFFAAYHGHSLADAHAAKGKQAIKYEYIHSQQTRMNNSARNSYWGPRSSLDIKMILDKKIENTTAIVLPIIDRDDELKPRIAGLPNIKQYHSFTYEGNHCCLRELTNSDSPQFFHFQYL
jgi:hypothetical protein